MRQSNKAGSSPSATNATTLTVDRTAPLAPSLALVADTGKSASDRVTSNANLVVGKLEGGASWEFSVNGGASWGSGSGTLLPLADGTYAAGSIVVRQRDAAGNLGAALTTTAATTIDTAAPTSPIFCLTVDSGISPSDQISNNGAVTVSGLLSGHTWQTSSNGGASWSAAQAATTTTFKLAAGSYGPGAVAVRQIDLAGNGFNNVIRGAGGADALTGGAGADDFLYASNGESLLGTSTAPAYDRIRDLVIGTDTITMATDFAAPAGSISHYGTASALTASALATLLPVTSFAAGTAAAFSLGSGATTRSFLVLNDSVAGYQAATDGLIEITGFSGNLGGLAIL